MDRPLTTYGRAQAAQARDLCLTLPISTVFHSPLSRAAETASIVARNSPLRLVENLALIEACLGVKEGEVEDDPADPFIERWIDGGAVDGAESFSALAERGVQAVEACLAATHGGPPLIVGHSAWYRALRKAMGYPIAEVVQCAPYGHWPIGSGWDIRILS